MRRLPESLAFLQRCPLPRRWGEGSLHAFSGLDGDTDWSSGFVLTAEPEAGRLLIQTAERRRLDLAWPAAASMHCLTGDALVASQEERLLALVFTRHHSATLLLTGTASLTGAECTTDGLWQLSSSSEDVVALYQDGERGGLAWGSDAEEAKLRAELAANIDPLPLLQLRADAYRELPDPGDAGRAELLAKCLSVMRVNAHGPQGLFDCRWSTPDKVPHRDCWLWDSVFQSFGINPIDAYAGWDYLRAVLLTQRDDGMIPHQSRPDGWRSPITQPPILSWGVLENFKRTGDNEALRWAVPRLDRYLRWNQDHRDSNGNGLFEWFIEDDPRCRSGESGLDNSQRFDAAQQLDAVDFSTFMALDAAALATCAYAIDDLSLRDHWQAAAVRIEDAIHDLLWDEERGLYCDRSLPGPLSEVQAVTGFLPLLLPRIPAERVDRLCESLVDPARFAAAAPVPSVSLDRTDHSTDMWRGSSWINTNWLVITGLQRQGRTELAARLRELSIALVQAWYEKSGCLFEFYDAHDQVPPWRCDRKGPVPDSYDPRAKISSIRDYHWTGALTSLLIRDQITT